MLVYSLFITLVPSSCTEAKDLKISFNYSKSRANFLPPNLLFGKIVKLFFVRRGRKAVVMEKLRTWLKRRTTTTHFDA